MPDVREVFATSVLLITDGGDHVRIAFASDRGATRVPVLNLVLTPMAFEEMARQIALGVDRVLS